MSRTTAETCASAALCWTSLLGTSPFKGIPVRFQRIAQLGIKKMSLTATSRFGIA